MANTTIKKEKSRMKKAKKKVLIVYTGGTIGMLNTVENEPSSPLEPATWEAIKKHSPGFKSLPFDVEIEQMKPLIDSSDMSPKNWIDIAKLINKNYKSFDGFVVLHGTDTMSYTATALSFIFENLDKPVIITGSQLPLSKARSDASQNLVTSLMIAASEGVPVIPEVCVYFNNVLLRGNRSRKVSSSGLDGFDTPNYSPLATVGEHIEADPRLIREVPKDGFFINAHLETNVMMFDIFPGISREIINHIFNIPDLQGVILRTYGTGNAPTDDALLNEIHTAITEKNIAVVNITQCNQGIVEMGLYSASVKLSRMGVISGVDMTPEAALVKMMYLIGQGYKTEDLKEQMQKDLRGEQRYNVFNLNYNAGETTEGVSRLDMKRVPGGFKREKIARANIRFDGLQLVEGKEINLAVYMNYPSVDKTADINIPQCIGYLERVTALTDCVINCTEGVKQVINPSQPVQIAVVSQNGNISWEGVVLSIFTDVE